METLLCTALDEVQAGMITQMLRNNDIPCFRRQKRPSVYAPCSLYGIDIYVEQARYDEAKELADGYFFGESGVEQEEV